MGRNDLANALPELRAAYDKLASIVAPLGITFHVAAFGGTRTEADTLLILGYRRADYEAAILRDPDVASVPIETWRPIAPYGSSFHNYGAAFDVVIDSDAELESSAYATMQDDGKATLGYYASQCGLRWGGNFPQDRLDPSHFELDISLAAAKLRWSQSPHLPFGFTSFVALLALVAVALLFHILRNL